jgi:hypothetical protein
MGKRFLMVLMAFMLCMGGKAAVYRTIRNVEIVRVETPVGSAPRLPYQLWVQYADGSSEYRQVKWLNSWEATEMAEANPDINPIGSVYKVRGFIIGDNTTPNGYPVTAQVKVTSSPSHLLTFSPPSPVIIVISH